MSGHARSRSRLLALAVLAAVFVAGALAGAAVDRVSSASVVAGNEEPAVERRPVRGRAATIFAPDGPLGERLDLSAEQREQVEGILVDHGHDAEAVLQEMRPRLEAIFERTTESIREVLEPTQQGELDRYLEERRETLRKRFDGHEHRGPRRGEFAQGES